MKTMATVLKYFAHRNRNKLITLGLIEYPPMSASKFIEQYIEPMRWMWENYANEEDCKVIEAYIKLGEDSPYK